MAPPPTTRGVIVILQTPGLQWQSSNVAGNSNNPDRHSLSHWLAHANRVPEVTATLESNDPPKISVEIPWIDVEEEQVQIAMNDMVATSLELDANIETTILDDLNVISLQSLRPGGQMGPDMMQAVAALISRTKLEFIHLEFPGVGHTDPECAFLRALEHNTTITSVCGQCRPHSGRQVCERTAPGAGIEDFKMADQCPVGTFTTGMPLPGVVPYWELHFRSWFWSARVTAICERNAGLRSRVHNAVFRVLSFARIMLRGHSRAPIPLPYHVIENIAFFASGGYLTRAQLLRLLNHAADAKETRSIAHVLGEAAQRSEQDRDKLRDEWLHNGGFWWDLGYDAARDELEQEQRPWTHTGSGHSGRGPNGTMWTHSSSSLRLPRPWRDGRTGKESLCALS